MNSELGFNLHPGATQDITEIWEFIADDSVQAARRIRIEIFEAIESLVFLPHQGHKRIDLTTRPLRFRPVREYLIAYAPDEKPLLVIAVIHGRRNPRTIAAILNQRHY
jgi:plasmid stabilization system protein ParE